MVQSDNANDFELFIGHCDLSIKEYWKYQEKSQDHDERKNHWTMMKGQGHQRLHECTATAALKGISYLTKSMNALVSKISIKSKNFALKTVANTKVSQPCVGQGHTIM